MSDEAISQGPKGLGGWLILPLIGLVATAGIQIVGLGSIAEMLDLAGQLGGLRGGLIYVEILGNFVIFLATPLVLLFLAVTKSYNFPRGFILYSIVGAAFFFLDLLATWVLFQDVFAAGQAEFFDRETLRGVIGSLAGLFIWIPYMNRSVRVKNTFIH